LIAEQQGTGMLDRRNVFELFLISFVALFLELVIIRWLSTEIRIFAYFKNLPLMAAFLGFGIGCSFYQSSETWFYRWFPRLFLCSVAIIALAPFLGLTHVIFVDPREYFLLGVGLGDHVSKAAPSLLKTGKALLAIVGMFFLVMATFSALCSKLGEILNRMRPLAGYSINVAGSLCGIVAFSVVSFLAWPPAVWLLLVYVALVYFYLRRPTFTLASAYFLTAIVVAWYTGTVNPAYWSPYYKVTVDRVTTAPVPVFNVAVNYDGFQLMQTFSPAYTSALGESDRRYFNRHYDIPFRLSKKPVESVLILGGGTGNDAAVALRSGAKLIDVVEIDPVIARIGAALHPDRPYASKAVHLYVDDARSFLQKTDKRYDLIIFATLDSHTAFSSLSSLRLDNFVFTKESLKQAANRLNPQGGLAINFFAINPWLSQRHLNTLKEALGSEPLVFGNSDIQEVLLLAGDLFDPTRDPGQTAYGPLNSSFSSKIVEAVTDDWPFLFLEERGIPFHYLMPLALIFVLSLIPFRYAHSKLAGMDWHLFFMGAAFLLIETKAVTTLGLLFGSTWLINAIVIAAILVMILVANSVIAFAGRVSFSSLYVVLTMTLLFNFLFPFDALNQLGWGFRVLGGGLIIGAPLLVAALIFAKAFAKAPSASAALASNLFGSLVGGVLEYLDMWSGLRWLNMTAILLYAISYLFLMRSAGYGSLYGRTRFSKAELS
jgi:hypothetical protein